MQHHCGRVFWNKSLVAAGSERRERSCVDPPRRSHPCRQTEDEEADLGLPEGHRRVCDAAKRNWAGRAAPDANFPARRWSGGEGVGDDWHDWWPDENDGEDATAEPRASDSETA